MGKIIKVALFFCCTILSFGKLFAVDINQLQEEANKLQKIIRLQQKLLDDLNQKVTALRDRSLTELNNLQSSLNTQYSEAVAIERGNLETDINQKVASLNNRISVITATTNATETMNRNAKAIMDDIDNKLNDIDTKYSDTEPKITEANGKSEEASTTAGNAKATADAALTTSNNANGNTLTANLIISSANNYTITAKSYNNDANTTKKSAEALINRLKNCHINFGWSAWFWNPSPVERVISRKLYNDPNPEPLVTYGLIDQYDRFFLWTDGC